MALIFILYVSTVVSAGAGGDDGDDDRRRIFEANGFRNRPGPKTCPRCQSNDTKFSYYNNRSLAQPRYFCRRCRRSWTHGGVIRDVPVGGRRRSVARRPRLVPRMVFPPATNIASSSRQPGQIMLDSPLPTTYQLVGVPPRAAAGPSNNVSYEHSMNRMMRTFRFGPMTNFEELSGPMAERSGNVPGWNVDNSIPLPPPPPPPQPQLVNVNHAENDDNIMNWSIDDFMGSGEF